MSLTVEVERPDPVPVEGPVVGIDRGIQTFAVCSDGEVIESPKALSKGLRKVRRLNKSLSRKQKGSNNRAKAKVALSRHHRKIANRRQDALHKATTNLAKIKQVIVVEDLNVSGMMRNRRLSRAIADMGWAEFARHGEVADEIPLSQRIFVFGSCGLSIDRDLNAAINLKNLYVAASSVETQNACGGESSGQDGKVLVKLAPAKQEPDGRARERFA